jgi:uncharacterized protein YceH (UPF0502 family)
MFRAAVCSTAVLVFLIVGVSRAQDPQDKASHKGTKATITKVNPQKGTVTVRMKNKSGKEEERTFHLTGDVEMLDSNGNVAAVDIFRSGDEVLVVEAQGKLKQLRKSHAEHKTGSNSQKF